MMASESTRVNQRYRHHRHHQHHRDHCQRKTSRKGEEVRREAVLPHTRSRSQVYWKTHEHADTHSRRIVHDKENCLSTMGKSEGRKAFSRCSESEENWTNFLHKDVNGKAMDGQHARALITRQAVRNLLSCQRALRGGGWSCTAASLKQCQFLLNEYLTLEVNPSS